MRYVIWIDDSGKEIKREPKKKGRPLRNSVQKEDGNWYVSPSSTPTVIYYMYCDDQGNVIRKEPKTRGRTKPGFSKRLDGHWYKVLPATDFSPATEE